MLHEGVPTLLPFLGHIEEHGGVTGELLHMAKPSSAAFITRLDHAQRNG